MVKVMISALVLVCLVATCQGWFFGKRCNPFWSGPAAERCSPCNMFRPREVTLRVRNVLVPPTFEETVKLPCTHSKTVFTMMMEAADANAVFKFSGKYFGGDLGFYVESINDLSSFTVNQTWWQILDGNNQMTPVGVSTYQPADGETVTFNYTQGWGH